MRGLPRFSVNHGITVRPSGPLTGHEGWEKRHMSALPHGFGPGLEGVVAFTTEMAEPDRGGGALRYRATDHSSHRRRRTYPPRK